MITCPDCGHENKDSALDCAGCGRNLEWAMQDASPAKPDHRAESEPPIFTTDQQPVKDRRSISHPVYGLWAGIGILGIVIGYLLGTGAPFQGTYAGENWLVICCFSIPFIPMVGTALGVSVGWLVYRGLRRVVGHYAAIGVATVCAAIICTILGYAVVAIILRELHEARFDNIYDYQ